MTHERRLKEFVESSSSFQKVLAGKITIGDFFTQGEFVHDKETVMNLFIYKTPQPFFSDENVAAAWITKLRYNQTVNYDQFMNFIKRAQEIFSGNFDKLDLTAEDPNKNDLCAIMWGIEALNGIQSFDAGATRVRLADGVAAKIVDALQDSGAIFRESTHATGTKLIDKGLSKDLTKESMRTFTPRGMGSLLVIPTSPDGKGQVLPITGARLNSAMTHKNYDLLIKQEDYGFNDNLIHSLVHTKMGFLNHLRESKNHYKEGMALINNKSDLAKSAENTWGKGLVIHRKEHLSELKNQSRVLIDLLEAAKKEGLFKDFTTRWYIRMKWPPFEKKIVASESHGRKGLGDFLHEIAEAEKQNPHFANENKVALDKIRGLITQANDLPSGAFEHCREGNEVLVNCESGRAVLIEAIAKDTDNREVDRNQLVANGIVSETNPDMNITHQKNLKDSLTDLKKLSDATKAPKQFSYKSNP